LPPSSSSPAWSPASGYTMGIKPLTADKKLLAA